MLPFLTVTAHYIDKNWTMRRQLLSFKSFPAPHTGTRIASELDQIIAKTGCERRFLGLVGDSASSNTRAVKDLAKPGTSVGAQKLWSYSEKFFHCSAHVFNLLSMELCEPFVQVSWIDSIGRGAQVVDDENVPLREAAGRGRMCGALTKLATMARLHNKSTTFIQIWDATAKDHNKKPKKLVIAAPTRWNSRYDQVHVAFEMRAVYNAVTERDEYAAYALSTEDWKLLRWLHNVLGAINFASKFVSRTNQVSLSLMIPAFGKVCDMLEKEPEEDLETEAERARRHKAIERCKSKLTKYYSHTIENPYYTFAMRMYLHSGSENQR